jgi:hypothetical protein
VTTKTEYIEGVPLQKSKSAGECLIISTFMVIDFWYNKGLIHVNNFPSYEEFKNLFPSPHSRLFTGFPPNKLWDYIKKNSAFRKNIKVYHRKDRSINALEFVIRQKTPPIVPLDISYYHTKVPSMATHFTVLRGYTPETFKANDYIYGEDCSYVRDRFEEAWKNRECRYILIKPKISGVLKDVYE